MGKRRKREIRGPGKTTPTINLRPTHDQSDSVEEAQKGLIGVAAELRELQGLPEAIQKHFEEQWKKSTGKDNDMPEPLMTMSQWKAFLESRKKAVSLPPTLVKDGLFTTACKK